MGRLWQIEGALDDRVERFTVGEDWSLDQRIVPADCLGSLAHATMLATIGVLTGDELTTIERGLRDILAEHEAGRFRIAPQEEDCHTAIENRLTERYGETGKKIHTGRSRNDQSLTALRLFARSLLLEAHIALCRLVASLLELAGNYATLFMPGRTHLQPAMPSSVGLWASAYAEQLLDDAVLFRAVYRLTNRSPLGSAAGFGVPLALDRELTARLLGFAAVHHNVLAVSNARGRMELNLLQALEQAGLTLGKLAQDLILFCLPEFGYFRLAPQLCTGSSIMPNKRNPDVLELVRARTASLSGCAVQVANIIRSLPSGYNRDYQETKGPFLRGCDMALESLCIMEVVIGNLEVCSDVLRSNASAELFATDEAFRQVAAGASFRDAYRRVASSLDRLSDLDPDRALESRVSTGAPGNLGLDTLEQRLIAERRWVEAEDRRVTEALHALAGRPVALLAERTQPQKPL